MNYWGKKLKKKIPSYINAGYYIFSPETFKKIKRQKFLVETEILPKLAKQKKIYAYIHRGKWIDAGTEKRLQWARKYLKI